MPLFDRYIAVDWSAANAPRLGRDSIWIGELGPEGRTASENAPTRHAAMASIGRRLESALGRGERTMIGFDFVFGYPKGAAAAIAGASGWDALWRFFGAAVSDEADNRSNRFALAERINATLEDGPHFWGHPHQHRYEGLGPRRPATAYARLPERRMAERFVRSAQPVWKLVGAGSVGSQTMLGIARLQALRTDPRFAGRIAVWPFETGFAEDLGRPVTMVEIYPSLFPVTEADGLPRDRAQVEMCTSRYAALDRDGLLGVFLSLPEDGAGGRPLHQLRRSPSPVNGGGSEAPVVLGAEDRAVILGEEGWIAGAGHEAMLAEWRAAA